MKNRPATLKLLIVLGNAVAMTAVLGQTTYTWTGAANGTNIATAGNWDPNGQPNGTTQDTAQWDGRTTTNLTVTYSTPGLPGTGFGTSGINLIMTPNQTNSVQLLSTVGVSPAVGINGITNDSPNAAFTLGDNSANVFTAVGRPAGAVHYFVNNSTAPATIGSGLQWQAGGGTAFTIDFGGTGDWIVNHVLRNNNSGAGAISVVWNGPGTMTWSNGGTFLQSDLLGSVTLNGGTVLIKALNLLNTSSGNQAITLNGGTLAFDAASQSDTIARSINGASPGVVEMRNGTLTLSSGNSSFSGNINLVGGTLVVGGVETPGASGPLGLGTISFKGGTLGFSVNNTFDYSSRFDTAANQAYSIDTGGQNVTFTNGLTSSSGTLTKIGAGTLILAGVNTYSGNTTVSVGKLAIQGTKTGSGNISVADSAALVVTAGGTQITPSSLTLGTSAGATLEFNNLSSTTTAPISASTLAAAGTVTINVNSGTFTPGQSYPLLTWTTGPAPTFSLGVLNGFAGNLSITANTLRLNITGTAYRWTGANNGTWDTTTANNWIQNGAPAVFANGGPVLFDDTSTRISVTVGGVVQPTSVTVDVNTNAYTITSSSGNNIGGSANLNKSSSSTLTLAGGANAYTGVTTISGGILSVGTLANGGTASDIGSASSGAANLVLNGGTLVYTGGGASSDRLFTLGTSSGTLDSSGSGALNLNNSGSLGYLGTGPRGLTLTGTDANNNTLAASFADNGGATTLTKNGAGKWILSGSNTYSGVTTIAAGILQVGAGGAGGSLGSGNVVDNGALVFNRTGTLIVSGIVSGTGSVTNDGTGTVILANNNTYSGGTTINAGTLQIGNGGATGGLDTGDPVANNGTLIFNSTGALTLNGGINGTGNLIKRGSGLLKLIGNNTFTGNTTIDAGAQLQIAQGNTGTYNGTGTITNNGTLIFVRQDNAVLYITNNIVGTGAVVKDSNNPNNGDVTLVGTNTYAGNTRINGGFLILGDGVTPGAGSIVGNVAMTNFSVAAGNATASSFRFNRPDDFTFSGNITGAGSLEQNGFNTVTLTGTNTYTAGTTIGAGTLQAGNGGTSGSIGTGNVANGGTLIFNRSDAISFGGVISSVGSVVKAGAGTLTLTASNTYTGFTVVSNGTLLVNGADSAVSTTVYGGTLGGTGTFFGPITLDPGTTLAPGGTNNSVGTLTINGDLSIGGNVAIDVNRSLAQSNDLVVVSGVLTNAGNGTLTVANLGPTLAVGNKFTLFSQPLLRGASLTITGGGATWNNNLAVDGSITVATVLVVTPPTLTFTKPNSTNLQFSWTGNFKLQSQTNTLAVGLSTNWVDHPNGGTSPVTVPIGTTNGAVNFRLISQ